MLMMSFAARLHFKRKAVNEMLRECQMMDSNDPSRAHLINESRPR